MTVVCHTHTYTCADYHSSALLLSSDRSDPRVREFWLTCESGFGFPSGHCMSAACVLYLLVMHTPHRYRRRSAIAATITVILISLSRLYVGAHFPLQVIFGAICGIGIGVAVRRTAISKRIIEAIQEARRGAVALAVRTGASADRLFLRRVAFVAFAISIAMVVCAVAEFLLLSLWTDPLHSLVLAREGCDTPASTPATTTASASTAASAVAAEATAEAQEQAAFQHSRGPFMAVLRDAGVAFGAGIGWAAAEISGVKSGAAAAPVIDAPINEVSNGKSKRQVAMMLTYCIIGSLLLFSLQLLLPLLWSISPLTIVGASMPTLFSYFTNYCDFAALTVAFLWLIPFLLQRIRRWHAA